MIIRSPLRSHHEFVLLQPAEGRLDILCPPWLRDGMSTITLEAVRSHMSDAVRRRWELLSEAIDKAHGTQASHARNLGTDPPRPGDRQVPSELDQPPRERPLGLVEDL